MNGETLRPVHFVGSIQAPSTEAAMRLMLEGSEGLPLGSLPDGEVGIVRREWVRRQIDRQADNPQLERVQEGEYTTYDDVPRYVVHEGVTLAASSLRLDYTSFVPYSRRVLQRVRDDYGRPDVPLQVGIINPFDTATMTMGFGDGMRNVAPFAEATIDEAHKLAQMFRDKPDQLVVQLESPFTMNAAVMGHKYPSRDSMVPLVAGWLRKVVANTPEELTFGVHLCLGDMSNKAYQGAPLTSGAIAVDAIKGVLDAWPESRALPKYIHFPIGGGDKPPLHDPAVYESLTPLRDIVPDSVLLVAGLAHERQSLEDQLRIRDLIEVATDRVGTLGIATACGIARGRTQQTAEFLIKERMPQLASR